MTTIKVLDALPGTGKSTAIFNLMRSNQDKKWFYVSPLLSEVEQRIKNDLPELNFQTPENTTTSKSKDVLRLIDNGVNVACTHALFSMMGPEHYQAIKDQGYQVVTDEEVNAVEVFRCKKRNVEIMLDSGLIKIEQPYGRIILQKPIEYFEKSDFKSIAVEASKRTLYTTNSDTGNGCLVTQLPIELFLAANEVYILTYMFKDSLLDLFFKLYGINWQYFNLPLRFTETEVKKSLRSIINLKTLPAIEQLAGFSLNYTFYNSTAISNLLLVGSAIRSVRRKYGNDDSRIVLTLPLENAERGTRCVVRPKDRPIEDIYLAPNTRATNDYAHRDVVLHLYNRNPNGDVVSYFGTYGLRVDRNQFALSELLQFIFRSAVRNGKPIDLYIASKRMRGLLETWLDEVDELLDDVAA